MVQVRNGTPEHVWRSAGGEPGVLAAAENARLPPPVDTPEQRRRLLDYSPGMLANRAVAWWQARRLTKDTPALRASWTERWSNWENMSRGQKIAAAALNVGAAALVIAVAGRASQAAGLDIGEIYPWASSGSGAGSAPRSAEISGCMYTDQPSAPSGSVAAPGDTEPWPQDGLALGVQPPDGTETRDTVSAGGALPQEPGAIGSRDIGTFTGSINPDTGYYFGTAYNTIAEELFAQGANPRTDIPASEYHTMVGRVLAANNWTWESARQSMQPGDVLSIDRSIFGNHLPPAEPLPPPPPPAEPTPPPAPPARECPEPVAAWTHWLTAGAAGIAGGVIGYAIGSRLLARRQEQEEERRAELDSTVLLTPEKETEEAAEHLREAEAAAEEESKRRREHKEAEERKEEEKKKQPDAYRPAPATFIPRIPLNHIEPPKPPDDDEDEEDTKDRKPAKKPEKPPIPQPLKPEPAPKPVPAPPPKPNADTAQKPEAPPPHAPKHAAEEPPIPFNTELRLPSAEKRAQEEKEEPKDETEATQEQKQRLQELLHQALAEQERQKKQKKKKRRKKSKQKTKAGTTEGASHARIRSPGGQQIDLTNAAIIQSNYLMVWPKKPDEQSPETPPNKTIDQ